MVDHVDDLLSSGADPVEPLANNLGTLHLPSSQVKRRAAGVEPAVPPDGVRNGFGLDFAFRPPGIVVDADWSVLVASPPRWLVRQNRHFVWSSGTDTPQDRHSPSVTAGASGLCNCYRIKYL